MTDPNSDIKDAIARKLMELIPHLGKDEMGDVPLLFTVAAALGKAKFNNIPIPAPLHTFIHNIPLFTKHMILEYSRVTNGFERQDDAVYAGALIRYYLQTGSIE